jgi:hypothetical protein
MAAFDLAAGLSLSGSMGDVIAGGGLVLDPDLDHGVQCHVEVPVAVTVQPVPDGDLAAVRSALWSYVLWMVSSYGSRRADGAGLMPPRCRLDAA